MECKLLSTEERSSFKQKRFLPFMFLTTLLTKQAIISRTGQPPIHCDSAWLHLICLPRSVTTHRHRKEKLVICYRK